VIKAAMDKLVQLSFDEATLKTVLDRTKGVYGMNNAVVIKNLEFSIMGANAFNGMKNELNASITDLSRYSSSIYEFRTRILAFNSLKSLNLCNEAVVRNLFQAMLCSNGRLAGPAAQTAEYFSGQAQYKQAMVSFYNSQPYSVEEKETLKRQLTFL
jgi:hypothetical protein